MSQFVLFSSRKAKTSGPIINEPIRKIYHSGNMRATLTTPFENTKSLSLKVRSQSGQKTSFSCFNFPFYFFWKRSYFNTVRNLSLQHSGYYNSPSNHFNLNISKRFLSNKESLLRQLKPYTINTRATYKCFHLQHSPYFTKNCFGWGTKNVNKFNVEKGTTYPRQNSRSSLKLQQKRAISSSKIRKKEGHREKKKDENNVNQNGFEGSFLKASLVGFAGGAYGALVGLGGSFVIIPLSLNFLGLTQHQAQATSLASVIGTGGIGATSYFLAGFKIDVETAIAMSVGAMLTANLGANLVRNISASSLQLMYGVLQLAIGPMVVYKEEIKALGKGKKSGDSMEEQNKKKSKEIDEINNNKLINPTIPEYISRNLQIGSIGLASGLVAGIFGIGGGAIVVPALSVFTDLTHHSCIGTSLCSMVPAAIVGMATHYRNGTYTGNSAPSLSMILRKISKKNILPLLIPLALGSGIGSYVGGKHIAPYVDERSLQLLFAAMMTYLGFGGINKSGVLQRILAKKSK